VKKRKNRKKRGTPNAATSKARLEKHERRLAIAKTQNGRSIIQTMLDEKIGGNFKNYVIIVGDQLLDWKKTMTMTASDGFSARVDKPVLVHKSKLKNIISQEASATFWHPIFGRLVDVVPGTKPTGKWGSEK